MDTQPPPSPPIGGRRPQAHVLADYSGRGAATVADELRRIGLRPGVQRVDAATPEEVGAILAQDPPAGASVARNSVITLYVGAASRDPAAGERPADHQPPDTAAAATTGPRRRRKAGHAHTLNATPAAPRGAAPAHTPADLLEAADTYQDGEANAMGVDGFEAGHVTVASQGDLAHAGQRVHHGPPRPAASTPVEASVASAGPASAVDARTLLTPLSGLPRPFTLSRWRRVSRRARLAVTGGLVCALALLALALADHHQPPVQRAASAPRQASRAPVKPPTGARSSPRALHPGRTPTQSRTRHRYGTAGAARPPRSQTPTPTPTRVPAPAAAAVTPPAAPAVTAPAAPAVQAPEPSSPATTSPAAVGGQVPGGPFSP